MLLHSIFTYTYLDLLSISSLSICISLIYYSGSIGLILLFDFFFFTLILLLVVDLISSCTDLKDGTITERKFVVIVFPFYSKLLFFFCIVLAILLDLCILTIRKIFFSTVCTRCLVWDCILLCYLQ